MHLLLGPVHVQTGSRDAPVGWLAGGVRQENCPMAPADESAMCCGPSPGVRGPVSAALACRMLVDDDVSKRMPPGVKQDGPL